MHRSRIGARVDDQINPVVLHSAVEVLFHDRGEAVNFVDEKHIVGFEVGEQPREISGFVQDGTGGGADGNAQLIRDDVRKGRFPQTRRAVQQSVIKGLPTIRRRLNEYSEVFQCRPLSREIIKSRRTQHLVQFPVGRLGRLIPQIKVLHHACNLIRETIKKPHRYSAGLSHSFQRV